MHNIVCTTSSTQRHQHNVINTTPSTQHHLHNIINTTPSPNHHLHNTISTSSSTQHHQRSCSTFRLVLRGRCSTWSTFIEVRGSPATIDYFGRRLALRGRRSTWSTFIEVRGSPATIDPSGVPSFRVALGAPPAPFCVAGAALGAPQARLAWQVQHLAHLH